jgi:hypothetical protein
MVDYTIGLILVSCMHLTKNILILQSMVRRALLRVYYSCLIDIGANGRPRRQTSDELDVKEVGQSLSHRPETKYGVLRDVLVVVVRQLPHRALLQLGVQRSCAWTRRIGVQTGRDHRLGKLSGER